MRKYVFGLGAVLAPSLVGAMLAAGCGEDGVPGGDDICGPCGQIAQGDVGISGDARIDGVFKALGNMRNATLTIQGQFDSDVRALADVFEVDLGAEIDAAAIGQLTAAIRAEITANVEGGVTVEYQPPRCEASLQVAVEAQADCEVKAGCEVMADPGQISVQCEGTCSGGCMGECSGNFSCEVEAPSIECSGRCEGACNLEAGGECGGTCRGECEGECAVRDAEGNCAGTCEGTCTGTCELTVAAECSGTCSGKCLVNQGAAECTGDVSCRGSCSAECQGSCEGSATPPSLDVDCEAAADCQASARAEANASLECTPPQFNLAYQFAAGVDAAGQAEFSAKIAELRTRGIAILQGAAKYEALLTGKIEGRVVFATPPLEDVQASLTALARIDFEGDFNIPVGKIACIGPAFTEAIGIAGDLASDTATTLEAQAEFVSAFKGGFAAGT